MVNKVLVDVERQGERKIWLETRCEDGERDTVTRYRDNERKDR